MHISGPSERLLNAKFTSKLIQTVDPSLPAYNMYHNNILQKTSIASSWKKSNKLYHRIIAINSNICLKSIKKVRFENVNLDELGRTNVSSAIPVHSSLKHSSVLVWSGAKDAELKKEIINWRLGRIAYHQKCQRCGESLSRKHAVVCSRQI